MLARRVDRTDPRKPESVQKFTPPQTWLEDTRLFSYDALLSTITYVWSCVEDAILTHHSMLASTTVITAVPDIAALSIICAGTLVMNIKPYAPKKDGTDMNSNAYASFVYVT